MSSPLFEFDDLRAIASDWRFDGVDLDVTHWWSRRRLARIELPAHAPRQSLHSLWIPVVEHSARDGVVTLSPWLQAIVQSTEEITVIVADYGRCARRTSAAGVGSSKRPG